MDEKSTLSGPMLKLSYYLGGFTIEYRIKRKHLELAKGGLNSGVVLISSSQRVEIYCTWFVNLGHWLLIFQLRYVAFFIIIIFFFFFFSEKKKKKNGILGGSS